VTGGSTSFSSSNRPHGELSAIVLDIGWNNLGSFASLDASSSIRTRTAVLIGAADKVDSDGLLLLTLFVADTHSNLTMPAEESCLEDLSTIWVHCHRIDDINEADGAGK